MSPLLVRCVAVLSTAFLSLGSATAQAPAFPSRPVRIVVPFAAGGLTDIVARAISPALQDLWGQTVIIDNRGGAAGVIGMQAVARSAPDGHTIVLQTSSIALQPALMDNLPYDVLKDFIPVATVARGSNVLVVPVESPATNLKEFIALAKASPGKYSIGSFGAGTSSHIEGALFGGQSGVELIHVAYPGVAPLVNSLLGGQVQSGVIDGSSARTHSAKLRPLAATGAARSPLLPDVPTFAELGYQSFERYGWIAMLVPARTPAPVVQKIADDMSRVLQSPEVVSKFARLGLQPARSTQPDFQKMLQSEVALYPRIVKQYNITLSQ